MRTLAYGVIAILWATSALAADLTKIDRRIARQPAYQTKAPRYCLLVFGPDAGVKKWLVFDGATLYYDRVGIKQESESSQWLRARAQRVLNR